MWIRLAQPYTFTPPEERRVSVHYKPGAYSVKRAWGEEMIRRGVAERAAAPRREVAT